LKLYNNARNVAGLAEINFAALSQQWAKILCNKY